MDRIYANENFPQPSVEALRELGHDVLTTMDTGKAGQAIPDKDVSRSPEKRNVFSSPSTESISFACIVNSLIMPELLSAQLILILRRSLNEYTAQSKHKRIWLDSLSA